MNNNTVVTASNMNYFWGVFLLIGSMRGNNMSEPVIVYATNYTDDAKRLLAQFGNVTIIDAPASTRSLTVQKPEAMILAETDYVTWVDCDGFFNGNCSHLLLPDSPEQIHIRQRTKTDNQKVYPCSDGTIPQNVLETWRNDIGEREEPRLDTCCSACFISLSMHYRDFLNCWRVQMLKVLPDGDVGVVDRRVKAYFQTDESVLNSLLCFAENAPAVAPSFHMNKEPSALYIHFVAHPKPWRGWGPHTFRHFDAYTQIIDKLQQQGYEMPAPLPFSLQKKNKNLCNILRYPTLLHRKLSSLLK